GAFRQAGSLPEPEVERDEIEGRADPGDAGDHVQPADGEAQPVPEDREVGHALAPAGSTADCCGLRPRRKEATSTMTFKKKWKILGHSPGIVPAWPIWTTLR